MPNALILGANSATGAYLARLLHARGAAIFAVPDDSGADGLAALGITGDVNPVPAADAPSLAASLPDATVYAVNSPAQAELVAETFAAATTARLCHIVDAAALRAHPAMLAQAKAIAALRRDQSRLAVNAVLHAHDSRLGAAYSLPALITTAAYRAANGTPQSLMLPETGAMDWGWTAEYVDAVARLAAMARPVDLAIGSGHHLTTADFVRHAFDYFKTDAADMVQIAPAQAAMAADAIDTERLKAATGWSASTWGRDLVRTLCEGAAARAG
ncbi:MAG: GDP-mannose 4,6-dehydratase [Polymorphobacter sp.]